MPQIYIIFALWGYTLDTGYQYIQRCFSSVIAIQKHLRTHHFHHQIPTQLDIQPLTGQVQTIIAPVIPLSHSQFSVFKQPVNSLDLAVVASSMESGMSVDVVGSGITLRVISQNIKTLDIAIGCGCDKRGVSTKITAIYVTFISQQFNGFMHFPKNGNH